MAAVTFDYTEFLARFPRMTAAAATGALTEAMAQAAWEVVASWLGADDSSPYPYDPDNGVVTRKTLLYLALCHLLSLDLSPDGQSGRIASASQGSVSTSFDLIRANGLMAQWWLQTPCGSQYWVMSAPWRLGGRLYGGSRHHHPWG